jgi:hypothetical protein
MIALTRDVTRAAPQLIQNDIHNQLQKVTELTALHYVISPEQRLHIRRKEKTHVI